MTPPPQDKFIKVKPFVHQIRNYHVSYLLRDQKPHNASDGKSLSDLQENSQDPTDEKILNTPFNAWLIKYQPAKFYANSEESKGNIYKENIPGPIPAFLQRARAQVNLGFIYGYVI